YIYAAIVLFLVGVAAGLFDIPLAAFIQHNCPEDRRGRLLAAYNFFSFTGMILFTVGFLAIAKTFDYLEATGICAYPPSLAIWFFSSLIVFIVCGILVYELFVPLMNILFTFAFWFLYHPKVVGKENIPEHGGALFVSNHVSLLDGPLLYTAARRNIRFFAHTHFIPKGLLDHLATRTGVIRVLPGKKVVTALKEAREGLKNGDGVGIFPEGGITRTGQVKAFENGFLSILKGDENVPIIPVYIGGLYGSMFSYKYGNVITPWPRKLSQRPVIAFGKPIYHPKNAMEVQRAIEELGVDVMKQNGKELAFPPVKLLQNCRKIGGREFLLDSTGVKVTGRKFLTAILALRQALRREVLKSEEKNVGLFVPMSVGGSLANATLSVDSRVAVNLNFTFTEEILNQCVRKAEIKHIITSRKMLERFPDLKFDAAIVCVEDLLKKITLPDKIFAALGAYVLPMCILKRVLGLQRLKKDDPLAIIFTSGSTGKPKGVVLTQRNIAEEARSFIDMVRISLKDTLLGFLPFFHAFGYSGNFWLTLLSGCKGVFHYSPLDAKKIGELARTHKCTFIPSTPTFLRNYLRRCPKEDFENVATVLCGAEKLPMDLIEAWEQKYGVRPGEGFGTTELSPCSNVNLPDSRIQDTFNKYRKDGSIGRALPNVAMKIVDLDTGEDLPPDEIGMMVAKGPIVMQGYYKEPELTAEVLSSDGWYKTGDVGRVDTDGFFWITGRQSRISKIGGEMVPHVLIEEEILGILQNEGSEFEGMPIAVAAVPDEKKGERIIVLHEKLTVSVERIRTKMLENHLPNIWIPSANSFYEVEKIPILGTGKLDLAAVKKMAASFNESN
ncbi:MAG: AMP-binding protein, partial [Planctomycetaceae bacterium]|nr:AMP-binding protein [Planctomycetaceae bacterium]